MSSLHPLARNPYTDSTFLCVAVPTGLVLLLWYEPLQKFMHLKVCTCMLHFKSWLLYSVPLCKAQHYRECGLLLLLLSLLFLLLL